MSDFKFIKISHEECGISILSINRPDALNALNRAVLIEMRKGLELLAKNDSVRVVIIRGEGEKAFIAGADIREMQTMSRSEASDFSRLGHHAFTFLEHMPKVTIAAVHGFALGGGMEVALACDFILASDKAQFGFPEASIGVIPGFGGTIRLSRVIGTPKAKELIFTGTKIKAEEARAVGLISHIYAHEQFFADVMAVAKKVSQNSLTAILAAKKLMNEFAEVNGLTQKTDAEIYQFGALFGTESTGNDQREGMNAFIEKRTAKFKGMNL